jgi:hypothetical protein
MPIISVLVGSLSAPIGTPCQRILTSNQGGNSRWSGVPVRCFFTAITRRYMNRLAEEGITERLFVLIGIAPLPSARTALWMREHLPGSIISDAVIDRLARAGDPKAEGKRICIELLQELTQIPAVSGAHIMAPRNHSAIAEVIAEARSARISSVRTRPSGAQQRVHEAVALRLG